MDITKIQILRSDDRGVMYNCDKLHFIVRKKDTTSADHTHEKGEVLFLINGEMELTVGDETRVVKAMSKIKIPPNTYHKLIALTDIGLLEYRY